jgi:ferredoxin--NADP+ reductase
MSDAPAHVAVIGSGPSGFYAADALLKAHRPIRVDLFDRLPTPYGLVRGGVAPDHPSIKAVVKVYERTAAHPSFRFFGNVRLGRDLLVEDLAARYDAWVYAVGNEADRHLGIPGEHLRGSHSATEFVGWYNGHPDHTHHTFDLSASSVAVVGVGNVAMDVARILTSDPERLAGTDIATYALEALRRSRVREVYVLGRRGAAQAAFTPPEIKELSEVADLVVRPDDLEIDPELNAADLCETNVQKNVAFLREVATNGPAGGRRTVRLRFCVSPAAVLGQDRVTGLRIEHNTLAHGRGGVVASGSGVYEELAVGLIFRSVGYRGVRIPGVPFDERAGVIPNDEGRVVDPETRRVLPRQYVVGWAKRGPSGLIGTNKGDSNATVQHLLADLPAEARAEEPGVERLLEERGVAFTTFAGWKKLDALELERGKTAGKIREKLVDLDEMVSVARS